MGARLHTPVSHTKSQPRTGHPSEKEYTAALGRSAACLACMRLSKSVFPNLCLTEPWPVGLLVHFDVAGSTVQRTRVCNDWWAPQCQAISRSCKYMGNFPVSWNDSCACVPHTDMALTSNAAPVPPLSTLRYGAGRAAGGLPEGPPQPPGPQGQRRRHPSPHCATAAARAAHRASRLTRDGCPRGRVSSNRGSSATTEHRRAALRTTR